MTQLTLDLSERKTRSRKGPKLAARMIAILYKNQRWMHRSELLSCHQLNDRMCRLGRECSHGRIICGQQGYKLTSLATSEEIRTATNTILAQIKAHQQEHSYLVKRAHRLLCERVA